MQDPKQLWLFSYMDQEYDDMDSSDFDEIQYMTELHDAYIDSLNDDE